MTSFCFKYLRKGGDSNVATILYWRVISEGKARTNPSL